MTFRAAIAGPLLGLITVAGTAVVGTTAAGAHDGEAIIEVTSAEPTAAGSSDRTYAVEVRVVWSDDLHPAEDADVTAVAIDSAGATSAPATLATVDTDGHYRGDVVATGAAPFTLRVTSADPDGTIDAPLPELVGPSPTTIAASPTTEPDSPSPTTDPTATTTEADEESASSVDDEDGGFPWGWVVAGFGVGAIAGTATMLARQRRQSPDDGESDHAEPPTSDQPPI